MSKYSFTPLNAGRKVTEALTYNTQTYTTTIGYNTRGEITQYTYPDSTVIERTYTDRGQLYQLKHASTTIDTRTYDNGGRMTASSYNNGVSESRSYNADNTLASIGYTGASIGTLSYSWDDNKNKTAESISGAMSNYGFSVPGGGYDAEDRLVSYNRTDGNLDQSWSLSEVGDWDSITTEGVAQSRTHGNTHELLTVGGNNVSTDVKGNISLIPANVRPNGEVLNSVWDQDNRLIEAWFNNANTGDGSLFDYVIHIYDALGRRIGRKFERYEDFERDNGGSPKGSWTTDIYVQVGQQTIADYPSGTASSSPTCRYVYGSYIDEPVYRFKPSGSESLYYHRNQQYSVTALTSSSGTIVERYAYSAYGVPTITDAAGTTLRATSSYGNRYTYTGREWDSKIGQYHYRARMYDPVIGRFCSRDPIGYRDGKNLFSQNFQLWGVDPQGTSCSSADCVDRCRLLPESETVGGPHGMTGTTHPRQNCIDSCLAAEQNFNEWYEAQRDLGHPYSLGTGPDCPCDISCRIPVCNSRGRPTGQTRPGMCLPPGGDWYFPWFQSSYLPPYHPGATRDIRTHSGPPYMQCTYDADGKLITNGPGVGTVDTHHTFPGGIGHWPDDVQPVDWIITLQGGNAVSEGCWFSMYKRVRPSNNGNNCEGNPLPTVTYGTGTAGPIF